MAKRVLLRAFLVAFAIAIFPSLQLIRDVDDESTKLNSYYDGCASSSNQALTAFPGRFMSLVYVFPYLANVIPCKEMGNITIDMFKELMDEKLLKINAKALCVGDGTASAVSALRELGFINIFGMNRHPFFSLMRKSFVYELEFEDESFDFVFSSDINRVTVPALLVLEIERVLKAGGIGAMLVYAHHANPVSLIKSATPISLYLKSSDVLHVHSIHHSFSLVIFRKKFDWINPFEHYQLPDECPSITENKPFMRHLEPVLEEKSLAVEGGFGFSYLSKFVDIASRKRFIYIDIGAGQFMSSNTTKWFLTMYPAPSRAVDVYVVDHNTTVLSSYVNRPGITFVYHPGLAGNKVAVNGDPPDPPPENEEFDFLAWFRETVAAGDFVVMKMNAQGVELQLLHELFESGDICLVDELFLRCTNNVDGQGSKNADCLDLVKGLRSNGVFVHQWLEN
ncbi:hypothetical protein IFM89_004748 [Coptis chinensis]|uniref:Methyltransferase type 11 domain-containing protein n=1 Tax=Coptis chinensis TaxID=261450 RepID=A0A835LIA0_9MAGN|nr:hypothetical protein IFM89_004748 [Coptis chinensis]